VEFEDALFQWVKGQPTVTGYIGNPPGVVRFFKLKQPQGAALPSMTVARNGRQGQQLACGPDGAVLIRLQVDLFGATWPEMAGLAKAFRRALNPNPSPYPMLMGSGDSPGVQVRVKSAECVNEFDTDDPEPGLCRRTQFWQFWVFEP
jgi:hypothetical protein